MTTTLYLDYDTHVEVTRERDPNDEWSGEDTSTDWTFGDVTLRKPKTLGMSFPVEFDVELGDTVYVVVAIWSTGDSFSRDVRGRAEIFGIFDNLKDAFDYQAVLEATEHNEYDHSRDSWRTGMISYPWYGYFESLDSVTVLKREVWN